MTKPTLSICSSGRRLAVVGALLVMLGLTGCVPARVPINLDLQYAPPGEDYAVEPAPSPGRIGIVTVKDDRSNKETIGTTNLPIIGTNIVPWLHDGLGSLADYGHEVIDPVLLGGDSFDGVAMDVTLIKLYCSSTPMTMRASLVCSVRFTVGGEMLGQRTYRGEYVKEKGFLAGSNYAFSELTLMMGLNLAMDDLVDKVEQDVRGFLEGA